MNLPLLALNGMPLGVQLLGYSDRDYTLTGHARWIADQVLDRP